MKYVLLMMGPVDPDPAADGATEQEFIDFDTELQQAGVHAGGFALFGPEEGTSVTKQSREAEPVVTAGPYAESREYVGGTFVIDVPDFDRALAWAKRCPGALGGGRVEIRALLEM
ncbi:YciI family protein [Granulicoccus phenolivorans]|uniref:YciI family protein n=1 Tax=Granulicoccus phenolivorans TaxID=266854 RepID=UPI00040F2A8B|nr:YciI family protein [Granulicoccus phenolivorans]